MKQLFILTGLILLHSFTSHLRAQVDCADGGVIAGGPFSFTVGDGLADQIMEGAITLSDAVGSSSQWVVTDEQGYILGLPPTPYAPDFDGAGPGTCLLWHLSYDGEISGLEMGANASELMGCYELSNSIEIIRTVEGDCQANGGKLFGGPFNFTVGDGQADRIMEGAITLANSQGTNSQWVVTDEEGYILGLPPTPYAPDFDGAGPGNCLLWHLSYDGEISGLAMGANASELMGCYELSNSIEIIRTVEGDCQANGGKLFGGPFYFTVGDGQADHIMEGAITLANSQGTNSQWVVTDDEGYILGLPPTPYAPDLDGAGPGTCLIWHLSYEGDIIGLEMGANASDIMGCYSLSDAVEVIRTVEGDCQANGGKLFGGPFYFTVGDGQADHIMEGAITLANSQGTNSQWVVTDDEGYILGLPPTPYAPDLDGAGPGTCLIWHLSYEGDISGLEMGANASDIMGCYSLSDAVEVIRTVEGDCQANGGKLFGGPFNFTVGDGQADHIMEGAITLANSQGTNSQWVVTDDLGNILGLPPTPYAPNFDGATPGVCLVWHLSYEGDISGLEPGLNASDLEGCYSLSDAIEVNRYAQVEGCMSFATAPVDLANAMEPIVNTSTVDRMQLFFYKAEGQIKYSAMENAAADIQFWTMDGDTTTIPFTKVFKDNGNPLFKWPVKFRFDNGENPVQPATTYQWRVRTYCDRGNSLTEYGEMVISPWSEVASFTTPDFDPVTGIYVIPGGSGKSTALASPSLELDLFPNPATSYFQVKVADIEGAADYRLIDVTGAVISAGRLNLSTKGQNILPVDGFEQGIYFFELTQADQRVVKTLMIK